MLKVLLQLTQIWTYSIVINEALQNILTVSSCTNHIFRYICRQRSRFPRNGSLLLIGQFKERNAGLEWAAVSWGGALRDDPNNGCEGDYKLTRTWLKCCLWFPLLCVPFWCWLPARVEAPLLRPYRSNVPRMTCAQLWKLLLEDRIACRRHWTFAPMVRTW